MRKLLVGIVIVVIVASVAVGAIAMGMTRYTATFTWSTEVRETNELVLMDPREPNITYDRVAFWDYILPGKGHSLPPWEYGYLEVWVNVTDSSNATQSGYSSVAWNSQEPTSETEGYPDTLSVKVRGLVAGDARAIVRIHSHVAYSEDASWDFWKLYILLNLEVG